jgi:phosphoserine phosphatase
MNTPTLVSDLKDLAPEASPFDLVLVKEKVRGFGTIKGSQHTGSALGTLQVEGQPDSLNDLLQQIASWVEGPQPSTVADNGARSSLRFASIEISSEWRTAVAALCERQEVDHAFLPSTRRRLNDYSVLAMDMDSTLITIECIDELGDWCGRKAEIASITEAAMRGEILNFAESLRQRVALLAGLDSRALESVYAERLRLSPGADCLLSAAHAAGLKTLLVSGGFTFFTDRLRDRLGLTFARANQLEVIDGKLTGRVLGEIIDAEAKASELQRVCRKLGVSLNQSIAIGDGANDLKMMSLAGLGVAYHAKPVVAAQANIAIRYGGLDRLLDFLPAS